MRRDWTQADRRLQSPFLPAEEDPQAAASTWTTQLSRHHHGDPSPRLTSLSAICMSAFHLTVPRARTDPQLALESNTDVAANGVRPGRSAEERQTLMLSAALAAAPLNADDFGFGGTADFLPSQPGFSIRGLGPVSLPIPDKAAADAIATVCEPAARARSGNTENAPRGPLSIRLDKITFENKDWHVGLHQAASVIANRLGMPSIHLTLHLDKLFQLPSRHLGGHLQVYKRDLPEANTYDFDSGRQFTYVLEGLYSDSGMQQGIETLKGRDRGRVADVRAANASLPPAYRLSLYFCRGKQLNTSLELRRVDSLDLDGKGDAGLWRTGNRIVQYVLLASPRSLECQVIFEPLATFSELTRTPPPAILLRLFLVKNNAAYADLVIPTLSLFPSAPLLLSAKPGATQARSSAGDTSCSTFFKRLRSGHDPTLGLSEKLQPSLWKPFEDIFSDVASKTPSAADAQTARFEPSFLVPWSGNFNDNEIFFARRQASRSTPSFFTWAMHASRGLMDRAADRVLLHGRGGAKPGGGVLRITKTDDYFKELPSSEREAARRAGAAAAGAPATRPVCGAQSG
ncbi:hypothetical protein V8E36_009417 [Tilletia maclaganii]